MKEYAVFCIARASEVPFELLDRLSDELLDVDGIVGTSANRTLEAAMSITASRVESALLDGAMLWEKSLASVGLGHLETISVAAVDADFADTDGPQPALPALVGIAEIADMGGLSPQRASGLARSGAFPRPVADLKSGPVFSKRAVERFFENWTRKPGRPPKHRPAAG